MRQINQNLRETSMKNYNQLKVGLTARLHHRSLCRPSFERSAALSSTAPTSTRSTLSSISCSVGRTPWFIAYDAAHDSVVISIRGTWSLTDVVTDILAGPRGSSLSRADVQPLDEAGKQFGFDGAGEYTHRVALSAGL